MLCKKLATSASFVPIRSSSRVETESATDRILRRKTDLQERMLFMRGWRNMVCCADILDGFYYCSWFRIYELNFFSVNVYREKF